MTKISKGIINNWIRLPKYVQYLKVKRRAKLVVKVPSKTSQISMRKRRATVNKNQRRSRNLYSSYFLNYKSLDTHLKNL